jgi:hypothetical protein
VLSSFWSWLQDGTCRHAWERWVAVEKVTVRHVHADGGLPERISRLLIQERRCLLCGLTESKKESMGIE